MESFIDPAEEVVDDSPPSTPQVEEVNVRRGWPGNSSVDDLGTINVEVVVPVDDRTEPEKMGYLMRVLSGAEPQGLEIPDGVLVPLPCGQCPPGNHVLFFVWIDGAEAEQDAFRFEVDVRAVDRAGNIGPASEVVVIEDSGSSATGCGARRVSERGTKFGVLGLVLLLLCRLWRVRELRCGKANDMSSR